LSGELFKMMTGIDMVHVPYRGGAPALADLLGGQVHVMFDNLPTSLEFIKAGKVRPLAVTSATRAEGLPEVPAMSSCRVLRSALGSALARPGHARPDRQQAQ
jgi:tripartite-type tricarboxylate transporter receptor subunit TctC